MDQRLLRNADDFEAWANEVGHGFAYKQRGQGTPPLSYPAVVVWHWYETSGVNWMEHDFVYPEAFGGE